jgi:hypothetical protein
MEQRTELRPMGAYHDGKQLRTARTMALQDESFCRGGLGWVPDQFNGAEIDSVVADSCQDENSWCRDDPYHLDQAQAQLSNYTLNGEPAGDIYPNFWNNRQISWYFEPAPNYTGDINIGFLNGANAYWSAISITHLPNGIHGVQYLLNGVWTTAVMDADLGRRLHRSSHRGRRNAVRDTSVRCDQHTDQQRTHLFVHVSVKLRIQLHTGINTGHLHYFAVTM